MSRTTLNFCLDTLMLGCFLLLLFVAVVVRFVFPPGVEAQGWMLWGLSYGSWCSIQFGLLSGFALLVLIHVMLHWSWVCGVIASWIGREEGKRLKLDDGTQTLYGVGLLIGLLNLLGLAVAAAALTIRGP